MIVGTAGHIDHGKTTLLKALTGVDADRLPEEKARGITVDLGFAYQHFADQQSISFLDVPGHEKLVRNMLAGSIGVDFTILVVAADDGVMPQTREHLAILDLVGVKAGVIALTKIDRVGEDRLREVEHQIADVVSATTLASAPVMRCSATTGEGIAALSSVLVQASRATAARPVLGNFRLAVDRSFTLTGIGLVVTGTVYAGEVKTGETLMLSPAGSEVRVRGIRSENREADRATAGQRCALNIVGRRVEKDTINRGDWIVAPAAHAPSDRYDVRLKLLPQESRPLKHWSPVHAHIGALDMTGRIAILDGKALDPGGTALAQLILDGPTSALTGDRFIIRDQSATRTLGGGKIIDPFPPPRGARSPARLAALDAFDQTSPAAALDATLAISDSGVSLSHFTSCWNLTSAEARSLYETARITQLGEGDTSTGLSAKAWSDLTASLLAVVERFQIAHPDCPGATVEEILRTFREPRRKLLARRALQVMVEQKVLSRFGQLFHLLDREIKLPPDEAALWSEITEHLEKADLEQPRLTALAEAMGLQPGELDPLLQKLSRIGWLTRVSKAYFMLPATVARFAGEAERVAAAHPKALLTVGNFREATNANRHMATPLLEFFDRAGLTRRIKDGRVIRSSWADITRSREAS